MAPAAVPPAGLNSLAGASLPLQRGCWQRPHLRRYKLRRALSVLQKLNIHSAEVDRASNFLVSALRANATFSGV